MKIIVVSKKHGGTRTLDLGGWTRALLSVCVLGIPVGAVTFAGIQLFSKEVSLFTPEATQVWEEALEEQQREITKTRQTAESRLTAQTLRLGELQARLVRLDALGERLTQMAKLDNGEFDFSRAPAVGGPELNVDEASYYEATDFGAVLDQLEAQIEDRQQQLDTLETLLADKKLQDDIFIAGRPIKKGWMSSGFGRRADPFTGKVAWHAGVDFAGKAGSDIVAVAAGVVTWADERYGYGKLVEVNHGNGFVTRYAHCKELNVKLGDIIKKGQVIAAMGSSGRSTGPHVHFEVYKNGRAVDPSSYIHRAGR